MNTFRSTTLCGLCALSLLVTAGSAFAQVELRGGEFIDDEVTQVSAAGVTVAAPDGSRTIGWDKVKRVAGEHEEQARQFAPLSDDLWRATSRLERGDIGLAAPILERLWTAAIANETNPQTVAGVRLAGPTGLMLAQSVASVRIAQGRLAEAVEPWTVALSLRRAVMGSDATSASSWLDPSLPPIFVQSVAVERLARAEFPPLVADDAIARDMFVLYRFAAATATGAPGAPGAPGATDDPAPVIESASASDPDVRLVTDLIVMQAGIAELRESARARLEQTVKAYPNTWRDAWARTALGIAGVESNSTSQRLGGALELLHIPARFASTQPYLAGVALAWSAVALRREGDDARAAALLAELERIAPDHPAIGWLARGGGEIR